MSTIVPSLNFPNNKEKKIAKHPQNRSQIVSQTANINAASRGPAGKLSLAVLFFAHRRLAARHIQFSSPLPLTQSNVLQSIWSGGHNRHRHRHRQPVMFGNYFQFYRHTYTVQVQ